MNRLWFVICLYLVSCILVIPAEASLELGGYYKNDVVCLIKRDGEPVLGDINKIRLKIDADLPRLNIHLEPQYSLLAKSDTFVSTDTSSLDKIDWDRAYAKLMLPMVDITAGTQHIAWGTGYVWNPTDVFDSFEYSFAVTEDERQGRDAVRVQIPLGALSVLEAVFSSNKNGVKFKGNVLEYDYSVSYVDLGDNSYQIGGDTAGELWELGVRSEAAIAYLPDGSHYSKVVLGWNYTFENGIGIDMEYFRNGAGERNKDNYDWTNLLLGNISYLAVDYFYLGLNKQIDEITSISSSWVLNADDMSFIFYPSFNKNIAQNVDLSIEALFEIGQSGTEYKPTNAQDPTGFLGSNILFVKTKYSF